MSRIMRTPASGGDGRRGTDQLPSRITCGHTLPTAALQQRHDLDLDAIRAVVGNRLNARYGVSPPVAALVAELARLGPTNGGDR